MKRHALFVGVNNYSDRDIHPLRFAVNDATEMAGFFKHCANFDRAEALTDPRNCDAVLDSVKDMIDGLGSDDAFVFFFAGHGVTTPDGHRLVCSGDKLVSVKHSWAGLPLERLKLETNKSFRRLFLLDACRTDVLATHRGGVGAMAKGTRDLILDGGGSFDIRSGALTVLCSCDDGECAGESERLRHGLFSKAILELLVERHNCGSKLLVDDDFAYKQLPERMHKLAVNSDLVSKQNPQKNGPPILVLDSCETKIRPKFKLDAKALVWTGEYDGREHGIFVNRENLPVDVRIGYSVAGGSSFLETCPQFVDAGEYKVVVRLEAEGYEAYEGEGRVTILPKPLTLAMVSRKSLRIGRNGSPDLRLTLHDKNPCVLRNCDWSASDPVKMADGGYEVTVSTNSGNYSGRICIPLRVRRPYHKAWLGGLLSVGAAALISLGIGLYPASKAPNKSKPRYDPSWSIWLDEVSDKDTLSHRTNNVSSRINPSQRKIPASYEDCRQEKVEPDEDVARENVLECEDADFQPVYFEFDSTVVPQKEIVKIDLVAKHLSQHEDRFVVIEGNCDRRENKYLSINRAEALCEYLIQHGVAQERIRFYGRVANSPMAEGYDEPAFAKNRRCEFLVTTNSVVLFNKCKYRRGDFCDREEIIHSDGSSTVFKSSVVEKKSDTSFSGPIHFILHADVIDKPYAPYTGPTKEYVVQRGDYLAKIAAKFDVSIRGIRQLNPSLTNEVVRLGQKILIPTNRDVANNYSAINITHKSKPFVPYVGPTKEYIVKAGDTLGEIAYENGITIRQLKTLNNITADTIRVGQTLLVPGKQTQSLEVDSKDSRNGWKFR